MRTNGTGNEGLMTMAVIAVAFAVGTIVAGGPMELASVVDGLVRGFAQTAAVAIGAVR
jgi:hypothetical protein